MAKTKSEAQKQPFPSPPPRADDSHKGDFGRVLVVAGSRGMSGAACLAGSAALRSGAGLVTVATPECILSIVASHEPSYMVLGLPQDRQGRISSSAAKPLFKALTKQTAAAIGPGLSQSSPLGKIVSELYASASIPLVLDADALNLMAKSRSALLERSSGAPRILTPHPGEFARLRGASSISTGPDRRRHAVDFARRHQVVLVLKGQGTIITDGSAVRVNTTGNNGMATGGSGDVLTGLIVGLLGQGMDPLSAAHLGAHLHGLAGDLAADEISKPGMIASDLLRFIGSAWLKIGVS